jgi:hypothetical protein
LVIDRAALTDQAKCLGLANVGAHEEKMMEKRPTKGKNEQKEAHKCQNERNRLSKKFA